jgi:signal transduction histidine kinase
MSYSLHTRVGLLEMDLALLKWELGERHSEAVRKMADSIEFFKHASVLVTRGLEFEELGVRASANLNLNDVVRRVVDRHRKGSFICQVAESRLIVRMNATHAEDIVLELVANAVDFADRDAPRVSVMTSQDGIFARLDVSDNGKGVHFSIRPYMFERFRRHPEGRLGMGLAYVKSLVEGYGGQITEIGEEGTGAHFVVRLPLIETTGDHNGK